MIVLARVIGLRDRGTFFAGWSVDVSSLGDMRFRLRDLSTVVSRGVKSCVGGDLLVNAARVVRARQ